MYPLERQVVHLPIDLNHNRAAFDRFQPSDETPPPFYGHLQLGENPLAQEPLEMRAFTQDPIEPGR
jgi:hypothetical protein